jgi:hypothetical protein
MLEATEIASDDTHTASQPITSRLRVRSTSSSFADAARKKARNQRLESLEDDNFGTSHAKVSYLDSASSVGGTGATAAPAPPIDAMDEESAAGNKKKAKKTKKVSTAGKARKSLHRAPLILNYNRVVDDQVCAMATGPTQLFVTDPLVHSTLRELSCHRQT